MSDSLVLLAAKVGKLAAALKVLVLDERTFSYLVEHDPQALKQALDALEVPEVNSHGETPVDRLRAAQTARREWLIEEGKRPVRFSVTQKITGYPCERCGVRYTSKDDAEKCSRRFPCSSAIEDARATLDAEI